MINISGNTLGMLSMQTLPSWHFFDITVRLYVLCEKCFDKQEANEEANEEAKAQQEANEEAKALP